MTPTLDLVTRRIAERNRAEESGDTRLSWVISGEVFGLGERMRPVGRREVYAEHIRSRDVSRLLPPEERPGVACYSWSRATNRLTLTWSFGTDEVSAWRFSSHFPRYLRARVIGRELFDGTDVWEVRVEVNLRGPGNGRKRARRSLWMGQALMRNWRVLYRDVTHGPSTRQLTRPDLDLFIDSVTL